MADTKNHIVTQGETLTAIAARFGFADPDVIWNAPQNAELKAKRKNPHVLRPGDEIVIPAKRTRTMNVATGDHHAFVVKLPHLKLRARLLDVFGFPRASKTFVAKMGERQKEGTTDADGNLEIDIGPSDRFVEVTVETSTYVLSVGELDPAQSLTGVAARLHNLGYGSSFDELEPGEAEAEFAFMLFADDKEIDLAAEGFESVCSKLEEAHGS